MGKKKINRRNFLQKASYLMGAAGVAPLVRQDLLAQAGNILGPTPAQAAPGGVKRMLELCFRQGVPFINLGAPRDLAALQSPKYVTNPYAGSDYIQKGSLYLTPAAAPLADHADNIAITQAFTAAGIPHTPMFPIREGGKGAGKTTPIISLAASKRATGYSIVPGVNWYLKTINGCCGPMKTIENKLNGLEDLVDIKEPDAFANLFTPPKFRVNETERDMILEVSKKLTKVQIEKMRALSNPEQIIKSHSAGVQFLQEPIGDVLKIDDMATGFNFGKTHLFGKKWHDTGLAVAKTLKAFANNLMATATISVTTTDAWHGYNKSLNPANNESAIAAQHLASILASAISYMKATPDPAAPGQTLFDTTIIFCSSEFTRGITGKGMDHRDQGTNGFILIGADVQGGYYGEVDTSGSVGRAYGFNPKTGAREYEKNTLDQVHNTICHLLGLEGEKIPGVPVLDVMLKAA